MSDYQNEARELDWDEQIHDDGKKYITLDEGDYEFTVVEFTRSRFPGRGL